MSATLLSDPPLQATLHEIGLFSDNPAALASFYSDGFGYDFSSSGSGMLGIALDRRLRLSAGPSRTLDYAAYSVPDHAVLESLARRLAAAGVDTAYVDQAGFKEGALTFHDPDGNRFVFGLPSGETLELKGSAANRAARIQHVVFASTDVQRLLTFFTDVAGFTLSDRVLDDQGGLRTAFVRCSHEHHSLAVFAANENRLDHHCYEAGEWNLIRDWADHFARARVPLKWGPGRHGPGDNLFLFIHDPDGNWVEISAELEHVQHDRPVGEWPHEERTLNSWGMGLLRS